MRKYIYIFAMVILCMVFTISFVDDDIPDQSEMDNALIEEDIVSSTFKLPASLRIIEEEAFEGTAVTQVDLPETLTTIEDRAFADAINLRLVNMPQDITVIGNDVFTGDNLVTITGTPDSYARTWAKNNGIPFIPTAVFTAQNTNLQIIRLNVMRTEPDRLFSDKRIDNGKHTTRKRKTDKEIKTVKYKECFANTIQGRSPPNA